MKDTNSSTLSLVMAEAVPDTKEPNKNGLNNNSEEISMYTSLNTPCTDDSNASHEPARSTSSNFGSRRKSETQGRGSRRLESIDEDSECFNPAIRSTSISTMSLSTPFQGFQVPETTVVPGDAHETKTKKKVDISVRDAIPTMPKPVAVLCLIFNILIPGSGTILSGFFAFCLSKEDALIDRMTLLCVNCFVGLAQMTTVVFLMIGWVWSIAWGCTFVGLSAKYGKKRKQTTNEESVS